MSEVERVRIICLDPTGAILLMKWRDPLDGHVFWEPPGGGIEAGETPRQAAERELYEETGYRRSLPDPYVVVARDYSFAGRHFHHDEAFFLTDVVGSPAAGSFTDEEADTFLASRFVELSDLQRLDAPLQPPQLLDAVRALFATQREVHE